MSWKSMSGMFTANHSAIGLRSKSCRARRRILVIQRGSPFHQEICSTTPALMPFSGANAYSTSSLQPSWYFVRSRSNVVMRAGSFLSGEFPLPP